MFFKTVRPKPAPVLRPAAKPLGIAGEIAAIAEQTSDPIARAHLNGLVPRIAAQQAALSVFMRDTPAAPPVPWQAPGRCQ